MNEIETAPKIMNYSQMYVKTLIRHHKINLLKFIVSGLPRGSFLYLLGCSDNSFGDSFLVRDS